MKEGEIYMEKKNVTFDDIAKFTGFSKTTISRFFNKPDSLTEKNQKIIKDALDKLGYQGQNQLARNLAKGKTEYIGVIIPNLYLHYFSHLLNNILQTYEEFGYKFMVFVEGENEEEEKQYIRELMSYQVEGLLMMSHQIPSASLAQLGIPVVGIEREDQFISSVNCDNYAGALEAVRLLESHHCDVYLHINTPTNVLTPAYQRIVGFQDYCNKHHLPNEVIVRSMGNEYGKILPVMTSLFDNIEAWYKGKKVGIFFADDTRANCFLNLLVRKYKTLPPNYKLVGFDDSPIATEAVYSLSTVGQKTEIIAREAVRMLIGEIRARKEAKNGQELSKPQHKVIMPELIKRESTELENKY